MVVNFLSEIRQAVERLTTSLRKNHPNLSATISEQEYCALAVEIERIRSTTQTASNYAIALNIADLLIDRASLHINGAPSQRIAEQLKEALSVRWLTIHLDVRSKDLAKKYSATYSTYRMNRHLPGAAIATESAFHHLETQK